MKTSNFLNLNFKDFLNGLIMAVLTPVVLIIKQTLELGVLTFNWKEIGVAALIGALAYLTKNLLTDSKGSFLGRDDVDSTKPKPRE